MRIYTIEVLDEFGRIYWYTHVCRKEEFEFDPNWMYQYWMRVMVRDILIRMGSDAKATWTCREEIHV